MTDPTPGAIKRSPQFREARNSVSLYPLDENKSRTSREERVGCSRGKAPTCRKRKGAVLLESGRERTHDLGLDRRNAKKHRGGRKNFYLVTDGSGRTPPRVGIA